MDRRTRKHKEDEDEDEKFLRFMKLTEMERYTEIAIITNELLSNKYVSSYKMRILKTYFTKSYIKTLLSR
jgi:hypothetical protein